MGLEVVQVGAEIPLAQIQTSRQKVRRETSENGIADLLESIKNHGQIHPLSLLENGDGTFELINGHRRYTAGKTGGFAAMRANIYRVPTGKGSERELLIQQHLYAANMAEPLVPIEKARMFDALRRDFGYDEETIAECFEGETSETVRYALSFLSLPEKVLDLVQAHPDKINEGQLRVLAEYSSNEKRAWKTKPEETIRLAESLVNQENKLAAVDPRVFEKEVRNVVKTRRDSLKSAAPTRKATSVPVKSDPVKDLFKRIEQLEAAVQSFSSAGVNHVDEIQASDKREVSRRLYGIASTIDEFITREIGPLTATQAGESDA